METEWELSTGEDTVMPWGQRRVHSQAKSFSGGLASVYFYTSAVKRIKLLHISARMTSEMPANFQFFYYMNIDGTVTAFPVKQDTGSHLSWDGNLVIPNPDSVSVDAYSDDTNRTPTLNAHIVYQMWREP